MSKTNKKGATVKGKKKGLKHNGEIRKNEIGIK